MSQFTPCGGCDEPEACDIVKRCLAQTPPPDRAAPCVDGCAEAALGGRACKFVCAVETIPPMGEGAAMSEWIAVSERLPEKREKPYQVIALCVKRYKDLCYAGEPIRGVYQDWVLRNWPQNYTHWMPIPALPDGLSRNGLRNDAEKSEKKPLKSTA